MAAKRFSSRIVRPAPARRIASPGLGLRPVLRTGPEIWTALSESERRRSSPAQPARKLKSTHTHTHTVKWPYASSSNNCNFEYSVGWCCRPYGVSESRRCLDSPQLIHRKDSEISWPRMKAAHITISTINAKSTQHSQSVAACCD